MLLDFHETLTNLPGGPSATVTRRTGPGTRTLTVTGKFKSSLAALRQQIEEGRLHYIRCLKPNSQKESDKFNSHFVLTQLRCAQCHPLPSCSWSAACATFKIAAPDDEPAP
jgi:myosin heavy subunit